MKNKSCDLYDPVIKNINNIFDDLSPIVLLV